MSSANPTMIRRRCFALSFEEFLKILNIGGALHGIRMCPDDGMVEVYVYQEGSPLPEGNMPPRETLPDRPVADVAILVDERQPVRIQWHLSNEVSYAETYRIPPKHVREARQKAVDGED